MASLTSGGQSGERLIGMAKTLLAKERSEWQPIVYIRDRSKCKALDFEIGGWERDAIARWLLKVHLQLDLSAETFAASLTILDRFLLSVRAHPKYLRCIAISCYFLAAKCTEEDERLPMTYDLIQNSRCGCSVAEVLRMERTILSKLRWNLNGTTAFHFLHLLHASLAAHPLVAEWPYPVLAGLVHKLLACSCRHQVLSFRPSTVAVSLISLELEQHTPNWLAVTMALQHLTELDNQELIRCREIICRTLIGEASAYLSPGSPLAGPESPKGAAKRKAARTEFEDDIYEGIKRLYGDDGNAIADVALSCGSQAALSANFVPAHVCAPV